jgi:hypothetical protein
MAKARKAGPLGISMSLADPFGIGKLQIDSNEEELERAIAFEGYERGLDELKVFMLLSNRRRSRPAAAPTAGFRTGIQLDPFDLSEGLQTLVAHERQRYERMITNEFDGLPEFVRNTFADPYGPNAAQRSAPKPGSAEWLANNRAYYLQMRPRYYVAGYNDPAGTIFAQIDKAWLLGKEVSCGLHAKFAAKLGLLRGVLESWKPGLAGKVTAQITSVGGFVPRPVAGSRTLSNHALGLAIDVDYLSNPHIKHPQVIALFNALVADTGFKFGDPALAGEDLSGISRVDQIAEIHRRSTEASRKIQAWVARHLPRYVALKKTIEDAQQGQKQQLETEKKVLRDRKGKIDTTGMVSTTQYLDLERKAQAELDYDTDMRSMKVIEDYQFEDIADRKTRYREFQRQMSEWALYGIQSFPLELAAGLASLGLRWGEEYQHHKDAMHFEFEGGVPPDVPGGRDPELSDLLGPSAKPWYLAAKPKKGRH